MELFDGLILFGLVTVAYLILSRVTR